MDRSSASKPAGAEAALSLQEELVAAIHGAFEVAVEIAVREVKKVVDQTAGDLHEEMRRENESLKQRLQRAEAMLGSARTKERGGSPPAEKQLPNAAKHPNQKPQPKYSQISPEIKVSNVHSCRGIGGALLPACHSCAQQPVDHLDKHVRRDEEHRLDDNSVEARLVSDTATDPEEERNAGFSKEVTEGISHVRVKVESINQPCQDLATLPSADDRSTLELVTVKQEKQEEERDDSICSLDLIKVEDFSLDCMFDVESKMLVDWEPEMPDAQSQDPNTQFSCTKPAPGLPPPTDLPSLSSPEPAPIPVAPPKIYEVRVRTSRNLGHTTGNLYTCKSCGQSFHLPSHLRRHYSQCPQKHQQRCQQPVTGSKRTRLQLYPPGCSPFRCTECDREFNRMENLKTHLRIHTGERPYTCSVCSKCFRHSGALTRHFRIHTGEKPYVCGQCGKSFRNCGGLKFHQRSHSKQLK